MQKLKKLEDEVTERERGYVQQGRQTCRPTQKEFQEVCHKCKQPGHYAHGCASSRSQINQEVHPPVDQVCDAVLNDNTHTIAINSVSNYIMNARVFGGRVSFLIDTGAAVSLMSTEVWDRIKPVDAPRLNPVNIKLVGVDGVPFQVKGSVTVQLEMPGRTFCQELIVANASTCEGILGLNFLEANECVLNLSQGTMCSRGTNISLYAEGSQDQGIVEVVLPETFTIAATSEVEVMGMMPESCEGVWTVEPKPLKKPQVMVARAIVVPQDGNVPHYCCH